MPLPDANKKSPRVYTNLQNIDLDNVTFANIQSTGNPIAVEEMNEDEMRRLVLVNLARLVTAGEWTGLLESGGGAEALGDLSDAVTTATSNVGLGTGSLDSLTAESGNQNTACGISSATAITTGDSNTAIGDEALKAGVTISGNVAVGRRAMDSTTEAWNSVAIGTSAGRRFSGGTGVFVAVGYGAAMDSESYGSVNIGYYSGRYQEGNYAIAIGENALLGSSGDSTGVQNIAIGRSAGLLLEEGERNILIGDQAGDTLVEGSGCVIIGDGVETSSSDTDHELKIAGNNGSSVVTWITGASDGACYQGDNESAWSTTSDRALKREITDATKGLDAVKEIKLRNFRYRKDNPYGLEPEPVRVGVIAQELEEVFPEAVKENARGHKTVSTDSINWALIKAVQELSAKVEALEAA
ncbi:MAG TPA: tail fiber domain-containing protein [Nitrospirales bacterium]|nr:tail fiber domain-containing protein [Nitrospirales bacterium]